MRSSLTGRASALSVIFAAAAVLLTARLYFVQIVHGEQYRERGVTQYQESDGMMRRGSIFFTTKDGQHIAGAVMESGWIIAIHPKEVHDAQSAYDALAQVTTLDKERFLTAASRINDPYEEVAKRVPDDAADAIRALDLPGVLLARDQWRLYPAQALAAQAIGFVGFKGAERAGVYGLERQYEDTLAHTSSGLYVNPFAEIFSNLRALLSFDPSDTEGSIVTTIEPRVQQQLETTLERVMERYTPEFAGGIVMDPQSGAVLAISGLPSFDPNTYSLADIANYTNRLVEGRYELGSIMKPLTVAAGIDSGAFTATSTYTDKGCVTVSTYKICNFDLKPRGVVPVQEILSQSLNVGAAYVAERTGYSVFTQYMNAYGFAQKTGIDLPGEIKGDLSTLSIGQKPAINYSTAAYGQGIAVTPIAMTRALSALANQGRLPNPYIVSGVQYDNGITRAMPQKAQLQVLKPQTAEEVTEMLIKVFDEGLLKGELKQERYSIAAKTGTAQIPKAGGGYYPPGTYLHSFFGYFPARDPRFIIFLFANRPQGQEYASATLARPFMDMAKFLINYYEIPPDR